MTYAELRDCIDLMTLEQLQSNVTVEIPDTGDGECYQAELTYYWEDNTVLDKAHPVIIASL